MNALALDIGGTYLKYALMRRTGEILSRGKCETPRTGREALVEAVGGIWDRCGGAEGLAVSMPGMIDTERGVCLIGGGALPYNDGFAVRQALESRCGAPVYVENDAKCAALAELSYGSLKGVKNGLVLLFGTMIGGGLILDGSLYRGSRFAVGEVSYILTDDRRCADRDAYWGNLCSAVRLFERYAERKGLAAGSLDGMAFFDAVRDGDEEARSCLETFAGDIALRIFNLQTLLDLEKIAIGGGISEQGVLIDRVRSRLDALYAVCPYKLFPAEITTCHFRSDANLFGALYGYVTDRIRSSSFRASEV